MLKDRIVERIERIHLGPHTETIVACFFGALFAAIAFGAAWYPNIGGVCAGLFIVVVVVRTVRKWQRARPLTLEQTAQTAQTPEIASTSTDTATPADAPADLSRT